MKLISLFDAFFLLSIFAVGMLFIVLRLSSRRAISVETFLLADRNVSWFQGSLSIAVSWMWAPAILIASLQAFKLGLPGAFWFIVPNVLCFFVFTPLAIRVRRLLPNGYTLPEFIRIRFNNDLKTHLAFLTIFIGYQLFGIMINALAGGTLLNLLTDIEFKTSVILISSIALAYSLISGLKASIITDVIQMLSILVITILIVPWVVLEAGGLSSVISGFGSIDGKYTNLFDPKIAYSFGIPATLALLSGPMADQMFFQRSFAIRRNDIAKVFITGGLLFIIVPLLLSILGFVGAYAAASDGLEIPDQQMIAPFVIAHYLPKSALMLFTLMALFGLCSTLDSAYCGISSLGTIDIYKRYFTKSPTQEQLLNISRVSMISLAVLGTILALLRPQLLWLFLILGAIASAGFFPTIFSVFSTRLSKQGAFYAIALSLGFGFPISVWANTTENADLIVLSALISVGIGLAVCILDILKKPMIYYKHRLLKLPSKQNNRKISCCAKY